MIVLDTNVLSELMRTQPETRVVEWLDSQNAAAMAVTAITVAEILYGIERMPDGRRKHAFATIAADMFEAEFAGRILPFDGLAATHYAEPTAMRMRAGRPIHLADAQIAAICLRHNATLATRNVKDFDMLGVTLINPWEHG